jgi:hypothetical protein
MSTQPPKSRLQHHQQEQTTEQQTTQSQTHREFSSVEDLLRHDANQTAPPASVAERLKASLENDPKPRGKVSWWRRLFGGK